jgi:hypothetical protein
MFLMTVIPALRRPTHRIDIRAVSSADNWAVAYACQVALHVILRCCGIGFRLQLGPETGLVHKYLAFSGV